VQAQRHFIGGLLALGRIYFDGFGTYAQQLLLGQRVVRHHRAQQHVAHALGGRELRGHQAAGAALGQGQRELIL
jgi:hypothetical protein